MCTSGASHLLKSISHIRARIPDHQIHRIVPRNKLVGQKHAINGEMQQTGHIIKCHCHLPKQKLEARSLLVPPLRKCRNQVMVKLVVADILKPRKTSGSSASRHHRAVMIGRVSSSCIVSIFFMLLMHFKLFRHCKQLKTKH